MPKQALLDVITAQKARYTVRELLNAAYTQEPSERTGLFKIIAEIADESSDRRFDRAHRGQGPGGAAAHHQCAGALQHAQGAAGGAEAAQGQQQVHTLRCAVGALPNGWAVRHAAARAACCAIRKSRCRTRRWTSSSRPIIPDTIKYLVEVLKDENEYARRAAVEVLNVVGTSKSVKYLLEVIADSDWWVRTRAADALGKIGGPRVVDAVLALIKDENQDIRRAAIEILNQTKDERAVAQLIEATTRLGLVGQRARRRCARRDRQHQGAAALHRNAGQRRAEVPADRHPRHRQDRRSEVASSTCCRCCRGRKTRSKSRPSRRWRSSRTSAARTPSACACRRWRRSADGTISQAVARAMQELDNRFSTQQIAANQRAEKMQEPAKTLLIDNQELAKVVKQAEEPRRRPSWTSRP